MPIYQYQLDDSQTCDYCEGGFEQIQNASEPALTACPECGALASRQLSAPNIRRSAPSLAEKNLDQHGFTQYKKVERGVYEKTVGKGPKVISDKD